MHLFCNFWELFGNLRATFGRLLVTKVVQRLQKVSQTRPNGFKTPQKGSEKTKWLAFLKKFNVFLTILLFSRVLASVWLLLASIGSYCAIVLMLAPGEGGWWRRRLSLYIKNQTFMSLFFY